MRCFCPPESCDGYRPAISSSRTNLSSSPTRSRTRVGRPLPHPQAEGYVLENGQVSEQSIVLENEPHVSVTGRLSSDVVVLKLDATGIGDFQSGDDAEQGGFARPARAEQRNELPRSDRSSDTPSKAVYRPNRLLSPRTEMLMRGRQPGETVLGLQQTAVTSRNCIRPNRVPTSQT